MTLTFKTAIHAIDKYSQVPKIVERHDQLTDYSVTRHEAEDIGNHDHTFKPCVVVTTAREGLEAAWELAYEPEDGVIPRAARYIRREREDGKLSLPRLGPRMSAKDPSAERRLLDAPEPEPEPEPWEVSQFCYAAGMFFERGEEGDGPYWIGGDCCPQRYEREDMAKLNPTPVTIEGEAE